MSHPNTVAHSAGAVCCPDCASAERHDRRGQRATWLQHGFSDVSTWTGHPASVVLNRLIVTQRRWTR